MESVGIYVGTSPETIRNTRSAIMDILQCSHTDEKTKQIALKTMMSIGGPPSGNSISNCHITMPPAPIEVPDQPDWGEEQEDQEDERYD